MAVDEIDGWVDRWSEIDVLLETKPLILCQHEKKMNLVAVFDHQATAGDVLLFQRALPV